MTNVNIQLNNIIANNYAGVVDHGITMITKDDVIAQIKDAIASETEDDIFYDLDDLNGGGIFYADEYLTFIVHNYYIQISQYAEYLDELLDAYCEDADKFDELVEKYNLYHYAEHDED